MAEQSFPPGLPWVGAEGAGPEAALLGEYWEAVLCYADLCTTSPAEAVRLAGEAFTKGIAWKREGMRLPWLPLLLTAVRETATQWQERGQSEWLNPELRIWLNADRAARRAGTQKQARRSLALRGLLALPEAEAELLWAMEVESAVAPVASGAKCRDREKEQAHARVLAAFRECCLRVHGDGVAEDECRGYAGLLDAATRSAAGASSEDLRRHLAGCVECGEAALCLTPHGPGLPGALASGVLGWGGLAYLERRRRAAAGRAPALEPTPPAPRRRPAWAGAVGALIVITGLALVGVIATDDGAASSGAGSARGSATVTETGPGSSRSLSPVPSSPTDLEGAAARQSLPSSAGVPGETSQASRSAPADGPTGTAKPPATATAGGGGQGGGQDSGQNGGQDQDQGDGQEETAYCTASYTLDTQWPGGFKAEVRLTAREALNGWTVRWSFPDGQRVTQMWDGGYTQSGATVTATAADYNRSVAAGQSFGVGFLGTWGSANSAPSSFTLDGHRCRS